MIPVYSKVSRLLTSMFVLFAFAAASGCATSNVEELAAEEMSPLPDDVVNQMSVGDNVVILDREGDMLNIDPAPASFYHDAQRHLEGEGFEIAMADHDALTIITAPEMVGDNLALRIRINVDEKPGGSVLYATGEYASSIAAPEGTWQQAAFTPDASVDAFDELMEAVRGISHGGVGTATQ